MKMLKAYKNSQLILNEVENANTLFSRFRGLMFRNGMDDSHGLLLTPCNEIHTFSMRFDIDAITLSKKDEILFIDKCIAPNKIRKKVKKGFKVLELNAGKADKLGLSVGDVLEFK